MWLKITDINLDNSAICIDTAPGETDDFLQSLAKFVGRCTVEGVRVVRIFYRSGTSTGDIQRLEQFAALKQLPKPAPASPTVAGKQRHKNGLRFTCTREDGQTGDALMSHNETEHRAYYRIIVHGLEHAVESINTAIAIIGTAVDLDSRSSLHLRLCIYELSMNTAEHGNFPGKKASIDLTLEFSDEIVRVVYRDDSKPFRTVSNANSGLVGDKISQGSKRGLGLYMINRLCSDFFYERNNNWNTSSFNLDISRNHLTAKKG